MTSPVTIVGVKWKTSRDCVGVVLVRRAVGSVCVFIGSAHKGNHPDWDAQLIADFGARLTFQEAHGFFPSLIAEDYQMEDDF